MKYSHFKVKYEKLEQDVKNTLKYEIDQNGFTSKFGDFKALININVFGYYELALVNDELTFIDDNGLHYSLYADCELSDLVDILTRI